MNSLTNDFGDMFSGSFVSYRKETCSRFEMLCTSSPGFSFLVHHLLMKEEPFYSGFGGGFVFIKKDG